MNNFIIYFITWANLIILYCKLTNQIYWSWPVVFLPVIALITIGFFAKFREGVQKQRQKESLADAFKNVKETLEVVKKEAEESKSDDQRVQ